MYLLTFAGFSRLFAQPFSKSCPFSDPSAFAAGVDANDVSLSLFGHPDRGHALQWPFDRPPRRIRVQTFPFPDR